MSQLLAAIELEPPKANTSKTSLQLPPPLSHQARSRASSDTPPDVVLEVNPIAEELDPRLLSKGRIIIVIAALSGVNLLSSLSTGLITTGLPRLAADIGLPGNLLLWSGSIFLIFDFSVSFFIST